MAPRSSTKLLLLTAFVSIFSGVSAFAPRRSVRRAVSFGHTQHFPQSFCWEPSLFRHSSPKTRGEEEEQTLKKEDDTLDSYARRYVAKQEAMGRTFTEKEKVWWQKLHELEVYKMEHGNCNVPTAYSNHGLGFWVMNQRAEHKKRFRAENASGKLLPVWEERFAALTNIGFEFVIRKRTKWEIQYERLKEFIEIHGHCYYQGSGNSDPLVIWVHEQRKQYRWYQKGKHSQLTDERRKRLDMIGFSWDPRVAHWDNRFIQLKAYIKKHGHMRRLFSDSDEDTGGLRAWVKKQRRHYKEGTILEERAEKLESIGFTWAAVSEDNWTSRFCELVRYKEKYGTLAVSRKIDRKLYDWSYTQKRKLRLLKEGKRSLLTEEQASKLKSIGLM